MIFLCGFLTACTVWTTSGSNVSQQPIARNVFRMNISTEPPELDPIKVTDLTSFTVLLNIMRGLTTIANGEGVLPEVATRWEVSSDGLQYTFHLDPQARWSDGKPVTTRDFLYAWQRALTAANGAEYAFFLFEIKNAKAFYEGRLTDFKEVGVRAQGDHLLRITLERPVAYFPQLLASPIALPLREDMVQRHGDSFVEAGYFITNGPYTLSSWVHENRIVLKPNPLYTKSQPGVKAVEMLMINDANTSVVMYENGELDYIETPSSIPAFDVRRLRDRPDYHTGLLLAIYYFGFNTQKPPFDNPKVRQAFAHALDRSYFPKLLQSGQQAFQSWIPPGLTGYNPALGLSYDPEKAKKLLAEAGYPNGEGFPLVTLGYRTMYDIQKEAEIAQYLWKKVLNVDVRLQNMEWKVFLSNLKNNPPDIYRLNWYADYPDADTFMSLFISANGNNHTRWKSPQYDQWVSDAVGEPVLEKRQKLYNDAQRLLLEEDTAILPIYIGEKSYLVRPQFEGYRLTELNLLFLDELRLKKATPAGESG
jgi:oligopeptide transport system substrate-binding protein